MKPTVDTLPMKSSIVWRAPKNKKPNHLNVFGSQMKLNFYVQWILTGGILHFKGDERTNAKYADKNEMKAKNQCSDSILADFLPLVIVLSSLTWYTKARTC